MTKPAIDATAPTERSIPPVSIVSVWQPARIASGTAVRTITPAHDGVTMPGEAIAMTTTRIASSPVRGTTGRSRKGPPDRGEIRRPPTAATALTRASCASR